MKTKKILLITTVCLMSVLGGYLLGAFMGGKSFTENTDNTEKWIEEHCKPITTKLEVSSVMNSSGAQVYTYTLADCKGNVYHTGPQFMMLRDSIKNKN